MRSVDQLIKRTQGKLKLAKSYKVYFNADSTIARVHAAFKKIEPCRLVTNLEFTPTIQTYDFDFYC